MIDIVVNILCRCLNKHKGISHLQLVAEYYEAQLDVRRVISNSISLRDFFASFLTTHQKALMAKQQSKNYFSDSRQKHTSDGDNPF